MWCIVNRVDVMNRKAMGRWGGGGGKQLQLLHTGWDCSLAWNHESWIDNPFLYFHSKSLLLNLRPEQILLMNCKSHGYRNRNDFRNMPEMVHSNLLQNRNKILEYRGPQSPIPGPWTSIDPWLVRNMAAQLEMSGRWASKASFVFAVAPHC